MCQQTPPRRNAMFPMTQIPKRIQIPILSALLLAVALGGCVASIPGLDGQRASPEVTPSACLEACALAKAQCEQRQQLREIECVKQQQQLRANYEDCLASGSAVCLRPDRCIGADLRLCEHQWQQCRERCKVRARFAPEAERQAETGADTQNTQPDRPSAPASGA